MLIFFFMVLNILNCQKQANNKKHIVSFWCLHFHIRSEELHSQCGREQAAGGEQDNCVGVVALSLAPALLIPLPLVPRPFTQATLPFFGEMEVKSLLLLLEVDRAAAPLWIHFSITMWPLIARSVLPLAQRPLNPERLRSPLPEALVLSI